MQFQIQGQNYYLKFDPGVGRWYLLKPTADGYAGMEVVDDGAQSSECDLTREYDEPETVH